MTGLSRPTRILLATDMSARSDRALGRAAMLAKDWDAELAIAYAVEGIETETERSIVPSWRRQENALEIFKQKMRNELAQDGLDDVPLHIEGGTPEDVILSVATREKSEMIVTGVAKYEPFGRIRIGQTTNALVRRATIPVLIVKKRARQQYDKIVVATDLSEASKKALQLAFSLFPAHKITVFYAYSAAYADMMEDKEDYVSGLAKERKEEVSQFLQNVIGPDLAQQTEILAEYGPPAEILAQYVMDHQADLVVAGTHIRSGLSALLLGSMAESILGLVPADILIAGE